MRTEETTGRSFKGGTASASGLHTGGAIIAVILLMVSTLVIPGATGAGGETLVTDFNGSDSVTLTFTGAGTDSGTKLSLEKKAQLLLLEIFSLDIILIQPISLIFPPYRSYRSF